ncbi:MAG: carbonic anhydrase family protein [Nitrosomonas sp.]|nr:carbonic anhydrase family protein [Nitrosomonas sp.]
MIKLGEDNVALQTVLDNMPSEEGAQSTDANVALNPLVLLPEHRWSYYTLAGSLTTPPCSEGVNWLILAEPITISSAQLAQLKSFYSDNARQVQDLNGRSVFAESSIDILFLKQAEHRDVSRDLNFYLNPSFELNIFHLSTATKSFSSNPNWCIYIKRSRT